MSEKLEAAGQDSQEAKTAAVSPQPSWLYFLFGSTILAVLALGATAVLAQFLDNRPVNLRPISMYYARVIPEILETNFVPAEGIRQSGPELHESDKSSVFYYTFDVDLPTQLNAANIIALTQKALREHHVETQEIAVENGLSGLSLSLSGLEFARVLFHAAPTPAATPQVDLRAACTHMAQDLRSFLSSRELPEASIVQDPPVEQRDDATLWIQTTFRVAVPAGMRPEDWSAELNQALTQPGSEVRVRTGAGGEEVIEGLVFAKMAVSATVATGTPAEAPPTAVDLGDVVKIALPTLDELPLDSVDYGPSGKKPDIEGEGELPTPEKPSEETPAEPAKPKEETPEKPVAHKAVSPKEAGKLAKIALILDDGGYHRPENEPALELDTGMTLSVLPHTPHGKALAKAAGAAGFEVMLHMPMQTHSKTIKPFPGQIDTDMDAETIKRLTNEAFEQVPGASGANNHTGSLFTCDPERMRVFLDVLKTRGLYFVDSLTISASEAFEVAEDMGVPAAQRTIFLDNSPETAAIEAQFKALVEAARNNGHAIGIGHFRKNTVAVIRELLPTLADEGCQLVHVSELVR